MTGPLFWLRWRGAAGPEWGLGRDGQVVSLTSRFPSGFQGLLEAAQGRALPDVAADLFRAGPAEEHPAPDRLLAPVDVDVWCDPDAPLLMAPAGRAAGPAESLGLRPDAIRHLPRPALAAVVGSDGGWIGFALALAVVATDLAEEGRQGPAHLFHRSVVLAGAVTLAGPDSVPARVRMRVTRHGDPVLQTEVPFGGTSEAAGRLGERVMRAWPLGAATAMLAMAEGEYGAYFALEDGDVVALETPDGEVLTLPVQRFRPAGALSKARPRVVRVAPQDNVAVALTDLVAGSTVTVDTMSVTVLEPVRFGHKIALRPIDAGEAVIKYGQVIGEATAPIAPGAHVHVHNFDSRRGRGDLAAQTGKERG